MKIEKYKCDLCGQEHNEELSSTIKLVATNNIFVTESYGGNKQYSFHDVCHVCSDKIAVFIRDYCFESTKKQ